MKKWAIATASCLLTLALGTLSGSASAGQDAGLVRRCPPQFENCELPLDGCSGVAIPILTDHSPGTYSASATNKDFGIFAYMGEEGSRHRYSLTGVAAGSDTDCDGGHADGDALNSLLSTIGSPIEGPYFPVGAGSCSTPEGSAAEMNERIEIVANDLEAALAGESTLDGFAERTLSTLTAPC